MTAGYDNALSLSCIEESDISTLEAHVEEKLRGLIEQSSSYRDVKPFKFLPGHIKTLNTLRVKAEQFIASKKNQNFELELLSEEEVADLPKQLFSKLNSIETPEGTEEFSETSLKSTVDAYISHSSKSVSNKAAYRCSVKCVLCPKVIPCTFNRRWETSNIEKHIKTHSPEKSTLQKENLSKPSHSNSNLEKNSAELDKILQTNSQANSR